MVLKLYPGIQEGLIWMIHTINSKSTNPMLPIHSILFNKYASNSYITIFLTSYFYPILWHGIIDPKQHKKIIIPSIFFISIIKFYFL